MRGPIACLALLAAFGQWQSDRWVLPLINEAALSSRVEAKANAELSQWTPQAELKFRAVFGTFTFLTPQAIGMALVLAAARIIAPHLAVVMAPFLNAVCLITAVMFCLLRVLGSMYFDEANDWRAQWDFMEKNGHPWYGVWCWGFHIPLLLCPVLDTKYHRSRVDGTTHALLYVYLILFHCMVGTALTVTGELPYPWYIDMYNLGKLWGTLAFGAYLAFLSLLFLWVTHALEKQQAKPDVHRR